MSGVLILSVSAGQLAGPSAEAGQQVAQALLAHGLPVASPPVVGAGPGAAGGRPRPPGAPDAAPGGAAGAPPAGRGPLVNGARGVRMGPGDRALGRRCASRGLPRARRPAVPSPPAVRPRTAGP